MLLVVVLVGILLRNVHGFCGIVVILAMLVMNAHGVCGIVFILAVLAAVLLHMLGSFLFAFSACSLCLCCYSAARPLRVLPASFPGLHGWWLLLSLSSVGRHQQGRSSQFGKQTPPSLVLALCQLAEVVLL